MKALWLGCLFCVGCAPLVAGPGRVLPSALVFDPTRYAVDPEDVEPPRPDVLRSTMPNGTWLVVSQRPGARLVQGTVISRCGRVDEPMGQAGLALVFVSLLERLDQERADGAPRLWLDGQVDDGELWLSFSVPKEQLGAAMLRLASLLRLEGGAAVFPSVVKSQVARNAEPSVRDARFVQAVQRSAVSGHLPTLGQVPGPSLEQVTFEALTAWAGRCMASRNVALTLAGDAPSFAALKKDLAPFATRPDGPRLVRDLPPAQPLARRVFLVPHPSEKVFVHLTGRGLAPGSTERMAALGLTSLFASEFHEYLRETLGHAYSIDADIEVGPESGASFLRFSTTREHAFEAARAAVGILRTWWNEWPLSESFTKTLRRSLRRALDRSSAGQQAFSEGRRALVDAQFAPGLTQAETGDLTVFDLARLFTRTFAPDSLQVVISGDVPDAPWAELGTVIRRAP